MLNLFKSMQQLSPEQVIAKLTSEIETLWQWVLEKGDGSSTVFYEKTRLLNDKIIELDKIKNNE